MYVGFGVLDLHIPHARDLKSKRRVVRSLVDRLHSRLRVSVAETGAQDLHQRAELGVALVARDGAEAQRLLDEVLAAVDEEGEAMLLDWNPSIVEGRE